MKRNWLLLNLVLFLSSAWMTIALQMLPVQAHSFISHSFISHSFIPHSFIDRTATAQALPLSPSQASATILDLQRVGRSLDQGDTTDAIKQIELGWKKKFEDYYEGKLIGQYVDPDEIERSLDRLHRLTGKKPALIYVIPTANQLELILVTPGHKPHHQRVTAANQKVLSQVVQAFKREVSDPRARSLDYLPVAKQLYDWLIKPLRAELQAQRIDTLLFCSGGGLRSLPIAALHDGNQFLIEQYSLAIIPAFNLLDRNPTAFKGVQVLAMGASTFQNQSPLPAVPAELKVITGNLWQGSSWLNQAFTVANLKAQRAKVPYGIVHLATHAEFAPGAVSQSYIQFWDQQLRPNQLQELGLRIPIVQLLVLSACRTALGDPQAELGFAGLAVQSGSKAAIASLWSVSDTGTLLLMTEFYRQLRTAPIKAEALRLAQIAMLHQQLNLDNNLALRSAGSASLPPEMINFESSKLSHPYYWAAFTLIGNPW